MKRIAALIFATILTAGANAWAQNPGLNGLYNYTPQSRTSFSISESTLKNEDAAYLNKLFLIAERAYGARLLVVKDFENKRAQDGVEYYNETTERILADLKKLTPPAQFKKSQDLIEGAIRDQSDFINEWLRVPTNDREAFAARYSAHPAVLRAHEKLLAAYYALLEATPRESERNKKSFYDALCALDFI